MKSFAALLIAMPLVSCTGLGGSSSSSLVCPDEHCDDPPPPPDADVDAGCTLTQGYWKNHEEAWPVASLSLGTRTYTKAQLLVIFDTPVRGNGLIALAHQLIAAKLNVAAGASGGGIVQIIADADAMIGSLVVGEASLPTSQTAALVDQLDGFNNGMIGPGHCDDKPDHDDDGDEHCDDGDGDRDCPTPGPACGNGVLEDGEACDDGNTANGDGCSATCTVEPPAPACGNHVLEDGEACDDGNTVNGDGCSATCTVEPTTPVCGNNVVEAGEQCDDGNTTSHDGCSPTCQIETNTCNPC